jgi:DNA-binding HxlR family transcriptional regulator
VPVVEAELADPERGPLGAACPIDRAVTLFGNRSSMLLLREASYGTARFDDFVRRSGLTESATASRLKELVAAGLLTKRRYQEPGARARHEYVLTDAGRDAIPITIALGEWADRHLSAPSRLKVTHVECGAPVSVTLTCEAGHVVDVDDLRITPERRRRRTGS